MRIVNKKKKRDFEEIFLRTDAKKHPFKVFVELYRDDWSNILLSVVFFTLKYLPVWVIPYITASIINTATEGTNATLKNILQWFAVGAVLIGINIPMQQMETRFSSKAIRGVEMRMRSSLVRKLQSLTIAFHKSFMSGRIQSKMLRDVESIEQLSRVMITNVVQAIINVFVLGFVTFRKSPIVALFFLIAIPVSAILIRGFRSTVRHTMGDFRKEVEHMSENITEMIEMIPVTKAHGLEAVEQEKLDKQFGVVMKTGRHTDRVQTLFGSSSFVAFNIFQFLCICFTGYLAYMDRIPVGDIALYQSYFSTILSSVSSLLTIYPMIAKGFEAIKSVSEILGSRDIENNEGKKALDEVLGDYVFENVSFAYPDEPETDIIKDFSLTVKKGECIAFVGESGSGKTSLLNMLIGFNFPTQGKLLIDGNDIRDINLTAYRKHIAVVSQNNILFSGNVKENITYGMNNVTREELDEVIKLANLTNVVQELPEGIYTNIGEHGGRLSGGQKQRIAIARAMIRKPEVIILDEATSALDNVSELKVQKAMDELVRGRTTFIVAHRLSTIRNADRIVVMKDGRCVEMGTHEELMAKKGEFYKLEQLQSIEIAEQDEKKNS